MALKAGGCKAADLREGEVIAVFRRLDCRGSGGRAVAHRIMLRALRASMLLFLTSSLRAQHPGTAVWPLAALDSRDRTAGSSSERTYLIRELADDMVPSPLLRPSWYFISRGADSTAQHMALSTRLVRPLVSAWFNTSRATPAPDGGVWQGRGLTIGISGGMLLNWRWLTLAARPLLTASENRAFTPFATDSQPGGDYRHPLLRGFGIDLPYRLGDTPVISLQGGESYLRVGSRGVAVGFSTASQQWGPAHHLPLVLGVEGPGFPRLFAEARSVPHPLGRFVVHWLVGRLEASPYAQVERGARSRLATAVTASTKLNAIPGFEVGGARFFHARWDEGIGLKEVALPLRGLLKRSNPTQETEAVSYNQLGSVFARLAPTGTGVEMYTEFYREDHNYDSRDLVTEPDHASAYLLGFRRAWRRKESVRAVTIETANGRRSHLQRLRDQAPMYVHFALREGHTHLGQPLGTSAIASGGAWVLRVDDIGSRQAASLSTSFVRTAQSGEGGNWNGKPTGYLSVRWEGSRVHSERLPTSASIELQRGIGFDRFTNVILGLTTRP